MELQDRTGACPRAARNEGGAEGAAAVAASAVIGAAPWSDHDPYTDEAFSIRGRGTSGCATPVPPCGAQVRDVLPHPVRLGAACAAEGSRAIVFFGAAANRDERKYPDPDRFDVLRNPQSPRSVRCAKPPTRARLRP